MGRLVNDIRLAVVTGVTCTWLVSLALLWALSSTNLLGAVSRHMPVSPGGVDREALTAGAAAQILTMLTVVLPAVLILLIAAGVLHRPRSAVR